jgi:predicted enzyme related to lactoylglutathione lyase
MEIQKPVAGTFCWVELQTKDPAAAKKLYSELFGWTGEDMPMPNGSYTMFKSGGSQVGGLMQLPEGAAKMGAPPMWGSYIAVDDVKATTDLAAKHGAKVLMGPTAMGPGTFSVIQDPTGGVFMTWHSPQPMGNFLYGEPGALCWNELASNNVDVAQRFYTQVFGWKADLQSMPGMNYVVLKNGDKPIGGLMEQSKEMKGAPSMWTCYFAVADADATTSKATKLGFKTLVPPTDIPNVGRFAWLQDPQGAAFAIIKEIR